MPLILSFACRIYGCDCPDGYTGDRCEYSNETKLPDSLTKLPDSLSICATNCMNHGKCREGGKDFGIMDDFHGVDHLFNVTSNANFEHCVCPEGFTGLSCEIEVEVCPNGTRVCFHGSECVPTGDEWQCNCNASVVLAAGPLCQHFATSTCDSNPGAAPFCVNGGACTPDAQCVCPDGFRGE